MRGAMTLTLGLLLAACSVLDNDIDKVKFDGGGADGDTDTDTDGDSDADECTVMILDTLQMDGVCLPSGEECEGGKYPMDPQGDCAEGDCCLGTDQCERYPVVLECSDAECADEGGGPFGCPDGSWCCPII